MTTRQRCGGTKGIINLWLFVPPIFQAIPCELWGAAEQLGSVGVMGSPPSGIEELPVSGGVSRETSPPEMKQ